MYSVCTHCFLCVRNVYCVNLCQRVCVYFNDPQESPQALLSSHSSPKQTPPPSRSHSFYLIFTCFTLVFVLNCTY